MILKSHCSLAQNLRLGVYVFSFQQAPNTSCHGGAAVRASLGISGLASRLHRSLMNVKAIVMHMQPGWLDGLGISLCRRSRLLSRRGGCFCGESRPQRHPGEDCLSSAGWRQRFEEGAERTPPPALTLSAPAETFRVGPELLGSQAPWTRPEVFRDGLKLLRSVLRSFGTVSQLLGSVLRGSGTVPSFSDPF